MKRIIRTGVFETNSSSTHALSMFMKDDFDKFISGETMYDNQTGDFILREDAIDDVKLQLIEQKQYEETPTIEQYMATIELNDYNYNDCTVAEEIEVVVTAEIIEEKKIKLDVPRQFDIDTILLNDKYYWNYNYYTDDDDFQVIKLKEKADEIKEGDILKFRLQVYREPNINDVLKEFGYFTYENYSDGKTQVFEEYFTTPGGETVVSFGHYTEDY